MGFVSVRKRHSPIFTGSSVSLFHLQVKLDNKPSRVVHIRNIPNEVSETEVIHLGIPFGKVTNVLVLKGKNQVRVGSPRRHGAARSHVERPRPAGGMGGREVGVAFSQTGLCNGGGVLQFRLCLGRRG